MKKRYQIVRTFASDGRQKLARFWRGGRLWLLPMLDLIEAGEVVVGHSMDVVGRAAVEAVLLLSAEKVAGPWQQLADRMLAIVLNGVSTRQYREVLPEMAERVGISRSQVSRETIEPGERVLKALAEPDSSHLDILITYLDGMQLGDFHVIAAVGMDAKRHKHLLGLQEGASASAVVAKAFLEDLVARGVKPTRRRLFVIAGSQALRNAIDRVYVRHNPVQRCRRNKERNVLGHSPKAQHEQAKATLRAA